MTRLSARRDDDRGAIAFIVTAMLVVLFGLAAVVVDLGSARDVSRQAQNAADAAALAAAGCMANLTSGCNTPGLAMGKARDYITANGWDVAGSNVTFDLTAQTVSVTLPSRQQPTFFAGVLGGAAPAVARSAVATWNGAGTGCSLCVLNDVNVSANSDLTMDQGDLLINGSLVLAPNASVVDTGGRIFANNGVTGSITSRTLLQDITGVLLPAAVPTTGPITPPTVDVTGFLGGVVSPNPSGSCSPGTYASVGNCRTFASGVYVITGATAFLGNITVRGTATTFVLTCSSTALGVTRSSTCAPGQSGGSIEVGGQANVTVTSPWLTAGICLGVAVVSDPNNTGRLYVHGTQAQLSVSGSIYLRSGTLDYGGGPDLNVNGNIVVGNYVAEGNPGILHALGCGPSRGPGGAGVHLLR